MSIAWFLFSVEPATLIGDLTGIGLEIKKYSIKSAHRERFWRLVSGGGVYMPLSISFHRTDLTDLSQEV